MFKRELVLTFDFILVSDCILSVVSDLIFNTYLVFSGVKSQHFNKKYCWIFFFLTRRINSNLDQQVKVAKYIS